MSEYLAGITILPLGNGIVDLITGFEKYDGDTEMWSNEAMGKLPTPNMRIVFKISLLINRNGNVFNSLHRWLNNCDASVYCCSGIFYLAKCFLLGNVDLDNRNHDQ